MVNATVTITPNTSTNSCVDVEIRDDSAVEEGLEVFFLSLSTNDSAVFFPNSTGQIVIEDNDGK